MALMTGSRFFAETMPAYGVTDIFGDANLSTLYVATEAGHLYRVRDCGRHGLSAPANC